MEYRQLGDSGLFVPVLCFGTATFAGEGDFFKAWGNTQVAEAKRLIDICLDAGINMFDTADIYSAGKSEEILGEALKNKSRDQLIILTKATFTYGEGWNNQGSSRVHILKQVEGSLKRLKTDYIDIYHMHGFDGNTSVEETLRTLDDLIQSGKVRYIAASNFSGWHLMKSVAVSAKYGWNKYIAHQVYYSLLHREYEWELMPLGLDQKTDAIVWSPLAGGRLGGRFSRKKEWPTAGRVVQGGSPVVEDVVDKEHLFKITDALEEIAEETGKSVPQVAINWVLQRPTVSSIVFGARNEDQLKHNLGALGWNLTIEQIQKLDEMSKVPPIYPYWHQWQNKTLNPTPDFYGKGHLR